MTLLLLFQLWLLCGTVAFARHDCGQKEKCTDTAEDCYTMCPDATIDINQVMGNWFSIMGFTTSYRPRVFCKPMKLTRNDTHVHLRWGLTKFDSPVREPLPSGYLRIVRPAIWEQTGGHMEVKLLKHIRNHLIMSISQAGSKEMHTLLFCRDSHPLFEPEYTLLVRRALHQTGVWSQQNSYYYCYPSFHRA